MTAAGGGSGKVPELVGGAGARSSSPFLWNKGKSVSEASVTPRRAKETGRVGPATRRKFMRAGTLGQAERVPSLPRGKRAVFGAGGGQHGVWAQGWGGGAEVGAQPPPLPLRAEFGAQSRARRLGRPRAPKSQPAPCGGGRGWEPNFFLPRDRHVSFLSSRAPAPEGFLARGATEAPRRMRGGGLRCAGAPSAGRFSAAQGAMCSRSGLGRGGGCALCVNCWECSVSAWPEGVSTELGELSESSCRSGCRSVLRLAS